MITSVIQVVIATYSGDQTRFYGQVPLWNGAVVGLQAHAVSSTTLHGSTTAHH